MIRNIIWDVDGTLFDTYPAISKAFQMAVNDLGKDAAIDWITEEVKVSLSHCVSVLAGQCQLEHEDIGHRFDIHYKQVRAEDQPVFPGILKVCQYICNHGGKNVIVTHRGKSSTLELLAAHHLTAYFSGWITRDDGFPKKPDPAAFEAAIENYQLVKEETIAVGDRSIDVEAGQRAGIWTCLFDPKKGGTKADISINRFDDLYSYLISTRGK